MIDGQYIAWAAGVAAGAYFAITLPGRILPKAERETVALWLTEREEERWARQFGRFFDALLGEKHFSFKRLVRSAISSLLAVGALYMLFGPVLDLLGERTDSVLSLTELVVFALLINIAADYVSLIETRWLLRRFEHVRSFLGQSLLLLVDLLLSTAIIYAAITAFRLARSEPILHPIEMAVAYTPFAIFFYSTFLTSVWAWAFCSSAWFVRLFSRLGLDRLMDVYERPFTQMGVAASTLVFIGLLAGQPLLTWTLPNDFDGYLCQEYGGVLCNHASRLTEDEKERVQRLGRACQTGDFKRCEKSVANLPNPLKIRATQLFKDTCRASIGYETCWRFGVLFKDGVAIEKDLDAAFYFHDYACKRGGQDSCVSLGNFFEKGLSVQRDYTRALEIYKKACDNDYFKGCNNLGFMKLKGLGLPKDYPEARSLFRSACEARVSASCFNLGIMNRDGLGGPRSSDAALGFFKLACEQGDPSGCNSLGYMYRKGIGVSRDVSRAYELYTLACDWQLQAACYNLALLSEGLSGLIAQNYLKARNLYKQACDASVMKACNNLAYMFHYGNGVDQDYDEAQKFYELACNGGEMIACANLAIIVHRGLGSSFPDRDRAKKLYERACNAGDMTACTGLGVLLEEYTLDSEVDYNLVREVYERACAADEMIACYNLAALFSKGLGVRADKVRSRQLLERACKGGVNQACRILLHTD